MNENNLLKISNEIRKKIIQIIFKSGKGHLGGSLSCVDILVTLLYKKYIYFDPNKNSNSNFILSKGHSALSLYILLNNLNLISDDLLFSLNQGSSLGEHPDNQIPGIDYISGSLGHGLGIGIGKALSNKLDNDNETTYVLLGDGECNEGSILEAISYAGKTKLSNIVAIIDNNRLGILENKFLFNKETDIELWENFGWHANIVDGHNINEMDLVLKTFDNSIDKPKVLIANTTKGKGVSFMENDRNWHHGSLSETLYDKAMSELNEN
tara:strand:- start:68 stop:868 length:801 start_codon:yes stop_codon:yes gene_type:complete